jgi:metallophosphoesterase (TIGR00282 family)
MTGDIIGDSGVALLKRHLPGLIKDYAAECVIVNGENSATNGRGITPAVADSLFQSGVHVITGGNHSWGQKTIYNYITTQPNLLRPANYPGKCPGSGHTIVTVNGYKLAVVNIQGRVFMRELLDCPFKTMETLLTYLRAQVNMILVDFHAEATAEKVGMGFFLDGKVSALVGTHTHIQTADARILSKGTAYISDLGMCGALDSMIGMKTDVMLNHMRTQLPAKFEVEPNPPYILCGVCIEVDTETGSALSIQPIQIEDPNLVL